MAELTNAQAALQAAVGISAERASTSVVLDRTETFLNWLDERDAK